MLLVLLTACKSEWEIAQEIIAENRGMAEAKLAVFEKVGRSAEEMDVSPDEMGKITAKGLKLDLTDDPGSNATLALVDDLVDLSKRAEPKIRFKEEDYDLTLSVADFLK
jgi:hypothetical protein